MAARQVSDPRKVRLAIEESRKATHRLIRIKQAALFAPPCAAQGRFPYLHPSCAEVYV